VAGTAAEAAGATTATGVGRGGEWAHAPMARRPRVRNP
jgi:hypothetical protein